MEYVIGGVAELIGICSLYLIVSWNYIKEHIGWFCSITIPHTVGTLALVYAFELGWISNLSQLVLLHMLEITLFWGSTIDKLYYILPDEGAILICICGFVYQWIGYGEMSLVIVRALCMGGLWWCLRWISRGGVGWGDIKWLMAISCWLSSLDCLILCGLSSIIGIIYSCMVRYTTSKHIYIPFGPSFSVATMILVIYPSMRWIP